MNAIENVALHRFHNGSNVPEHHILVEKGLVYPKLHYFGVTLGKHDIVFGNALGKLAFEKLVGQLVNGELLI